MMMQGQTRKDEDLGFGLFILALLVANVVPSIIIYQVLWWTGAAQRDMLLHCNDRSEVVAHALLLTWGTWAVIGLAALTWKAKTFQSLVFRSVWLIFVSFGVYRGFF